MKLSATSRRRSSVAGRHPRRGLRSSLLLAGIAALAVVGFSGTAASADRPSGAQSTFGPGSGSGLTLPGLGGERYRITLITGDVVELSAAGGGRYTLGVEPAPRPDGSVPAVEISGTGNELYAVPDDARPYVAGGRLDKKLFNISYLAANGYADAVHGLLPVIVEYAERLSVSAERQRAQALPASDLTAMLESIDAAALRVSKANAEAFWASLSGEQDAAGANAPSLETGATRVWLDRQVEIDLSESVPRIGAPDAWAAGYDGTGVKVAVLDTGADATHPDLAGKIVASRSFVPGQAVADGHGHGTHVAATVAGSGAASGGARKGVAPGAELFVGKVLSNSGTGPISRVINGMEWAAVEQDADVINMSLGSPPTDGTDPGSQAINRLTRDTGALFVTSAGNAGPGAETVGSPGGADAALTVAAVSKTDQLADFSGRGPRAGDSALKPDIAAPGVGIVAARAAGTSLGTPVDERYTSLNGTSMAAPHVAGAAAILAQRHPSWTATQLKPALMSTATDAGFTVYQQGAGRVDIARAVRQQVFTTTPNVDFKIVRPPFNDDTLTRTIAYTNLGDQPITLAIAPQLERSDGSAAEGALTAPPSLTLSAGGTASIDVTLDPGHLDPDQYSGAVVATGPSGVRAVTPVGLNVGHQLYRLTVNFIRRQKDAGPWLPTNGFVDSCVTVFVVGIAGPGVDSHQSVPQQCWNEPAAPRHPVTFEVPAGTYFASALTEWHSGNLYRHGTLINPEFKVAGDTEITLDADEAEPITIDTPHSAEVADQWLTGMRTTTSGASFQFGRFTTDKSKPSMWVTPTKRVTKGEFAFSPHYLLAAPRVTVSLSKPTRAKLHPFAHGIGLVGGQRDPLTFSAERRLQLVYAGDGTVDDFANVDVRGKLVLLRVQPALRSDGSVDSGAWWIPWVRRAQLERALAAGAEGVLYHPEQGILTEIRMDGSTVAAPRIPFALLPAPEANWLISLLARGRVELTVGGTPAGESPFLYALKPYDEGRVRSRPHYSFTKRNLVALDAHLHADQPNEHRLSFATRREIDGNLAFLVGYGGFDAPKRVPVLAGPLYDDAFLTIHDRVGIGEADIDIGSYALNRATERDTHFFERPQAPGVEGMPLVVPGHLPALCAGCRQANMFYPLVPLTTAEQHRIGSVIGVGEEDIRLFRNGVEIPRGSGVFGLGFELAPESARYRLTFDLETFDSAWDFGSSEVTKDETPGGYVCIELLLGSLTTPCRPDPLIFLRYDADVALDNTVRAGRWDEIRVTADRQAPRGPKVAWLKLWFSTDDGATWERARVKPRGNGVFEADVWYPKLSQTTGAVSLKAEAWDLAGNHVEQTLTRAFGLRDGHDRDDNDDD